MLGRQQGLVCPCPRNPARRLAPVTCTRAHAVPLPGRAAARPALTVPPFPPPQAFTWRFCPGPGPGRLPLILQVLA